MSFPPLEDRTRPRITHFGGKVRLAVPAIYVQHHGLLRRLVYVSRIGDTLYLRWRWPWERDKEGGR